MEELYKLRLAFEATDEFEWFKWLHKMPYISFPADWQIRIIPPYHGAIVRFLVSKVNLLNNVSVYLDCYDLLKPPYGEPYWEVHPYGNNEDDVYRCPMNNVDDLLNAIEKSLEQVKRKEETEAKPEAKQ